LMVAFFAAGSIANKHMKEQSNQVKQMRQMYNRTKG
jgi:hypothetical protein